MDGSQGVCVAPRWAVLDFNQFSIAHSVSLNLMRKTDSQSGFSMWNEPVFCLHLFLYQKHSTEHDCLPGFKQFKTHEIST